MLWRGIKASQGTAPWRVGKVALLEAFGVASPAEEAAKSNRNCHPARSSQCRPGWSIHFKVRIGKGSLLLHIAKIPPSIAVLISESSYVARQQLTEVPTFQDRVTQIIVVVSAEGCNVHQVPPCCYTSGCTSHREKNFRSRWHCFTASGQLGVITAVFSIMKAVLLNPLALRDR